MVQVKPINRRALRRYGEFWRALQMVGNALAEAERVAAKATDNQPARGQTAHWAAATPDEMKSATKKAKNSLHIMSAAAKKWEAELVSREWRR
ncbi:hypothetical protein [Pseudonocardia sp. 73-21]|uniref:hypothetical protein n=1 Tax=Pseudonocardia sp. 73-21 TaxID=1895809 RepID=UPI0026218012|nr:hypothetical protein [Pseudonocardia sp. 73-21]